ncbi:Uncharacterised protein [Slackia heliotrinireducens]|uniref:DUF3990 domain-containing protein n=1 Tax=Slackia heliotrinireducens (strain ATCC 29202 / DSM 20476 / NCTC 11029 / RHS 1) TaxID=471855 RepID=C7N238_SLAHD|nr:DUF3990 domain-containing protein [Slackia heliotrinireducens]ACV21344.1 hypothetical protein Shel_02760 [Slackia heliotrinireducens DSM 20476]VEG98778.1 Uncharacterised protein [Slackia heliotrinireducens]
MAKLVLFHGSDHVVDKPVFGGGRARNDYGRGFYAIRSAYFNLERNRREPDDLYILHILDQKVGPDDPRLR